MRSFKFIFLILAMFSGIISCKKSPANNALPPELATINSFRSLVNDSITNDPYNNYVIITASQTANPIDRENAFSISACAKFTNPNGQVTNTGPVKINGRVITAGANNLYQYDYEGSSLAEGKALMGSDVTINATGAGNDDNGNATSFTSSLFNTVITVPKQIFSSTIALPKTSVDKSLPFPLAWTPDDNNQFGKVNIEVSYMKGISQYNAVNMPNSINHLVYQVADNGSFTIPAVDLSIFPVGSYVNISISRAYMINTTGNIAYLSVVEAHTIPLLVTVPQTPTTPIVASFDVYLNNAFNYVECSSTSSGGIFPYTYKWFWKRINNNPYFPLNWTQIGSQSLIDLPHGIYPTLYNYTSIKLQVTDAAGNSSEIIKTVFL